MKKSRFANGMAAIMLMLFFSCQKEVSKREDGKLEQKSVSTQSATTSQQTLSIPCGQPLVKDLMDMGGTVNWGNITISNDNTNINVQVKSVLPGMYIRKITIVYGSQQHVTDAITNQIAWTPCQGPAVFDIQQTYVAGTTTTANIPIANSNFQPDGCIWLTIQVHLEAAGGTLGCAYAYPYDGSVIGSAQWQSAFKYCRQDCPPPPADCGQLRTQTPGGWGAPPSGNNPGSYLHAHFAAVFPSGLTVGCTPNYNVHLTSAQAITTLLPTGGQAQVLTQNYTDPSSIKNVLVGQLVALTLSVNFDIADPDFGKAGITLGQMKIGSGPFAGWTVSNFLSEANKALGGCGSYTPKQVLETADKINQNYVDGTVDGGFLVCPN